MLLCWSFPVDLTQLTSQAGNFPARVSADDIWSHKHSYSINAPNEDAVRAGMFAPKGLSAMPDMGERVEFKSNLSNNFFLSPHEGEIPHYEDFEVFPSKAGPKDAEQQLGGLLCGESPFKTQLLPSGGHSCGIFGSDGKEETWPEFNPSITISQTAEEKDFDLLLHSWPEIVSDSQNAAGNREHELHWDMAGLDSGLDLVETLPSRREHFHKYWH